MGRLIAMLFVAAATQFAFASLAAAAERIVSIGGSVTEIVYALGEGGRLVARDSTSTFPEEATKLPDVGYMRQLSPEGVIAVNPTAILAVEGSGPPDALAVLKSAGIPFETVPEGYDRAAILKKIDVVGKFLGVEDKAKELEAQVSADLDANQLTDVSALAALSRLDTVSLIGNPLSDASPLANLSEAHRLLLSDTLITELPDWHPNPNYHCNYLEAERVPLNDAALTLQFAELCETRRVNVLLSNQDCSPCVALP